MTTIATPGIEPITFIIPDWFLWLVVAFLFGSLITNGVTIWLKLEELRLRKLIEKSKR